MVGYCIGYAVLGLFIAILSATTGLCKDNEPVVCGIIAIMWPLYVVVLLFVMISFFIGLISISISNCFKKMVSKK